MRVTKALDLAALADQLTAAGVPVPRGLGTSGTATDGSTDVFTYTAQGQPQDLPAAAAPVVAAHDATQTPAAQQAAQDSTDLNTLRTSLAAALTALQTALTANAADQATVTSAAGAMLTALQLNPVLTNLLQREQQRLQREQRTLRALGVLVRRSQGP